MVSVAQRKTSGPVLTWTGRYYYEPAFDRNPTRILEPIDADSFADPKTVWPQDIERKMFRQMNCLKHHVGLGWAWDFHRRLNGLRDIVTRRFWSMIHRVGKYGHHAKDCENADDSATLGFVKALDRFDYSRPTRFSTYAWAMMRVEVKQENIRESGLAERRRRLSDHFVFPTGQRDSPEESRQMLRPFLRGLHRQDRRALMMRFGLTMNGPMSMQEVATKLEIPLSTAKYRVRRAMRMIREKHGHRDG